MIPDDIILLYMDYGIDFLAQGFCFFLVKAFKEIVQKLF